jgi:ribosomal protein S18 acetylase RimI-like enzyme
MNGIIKEIAEKDIDACVNVIRSSFQTVADEFGFTKENAPRYTAFATDDRRIRWQMLGEQRPMYAYFDEGSIVGYYSLALQDNNECELNNLCVIPACRHKGIGEALLSDAFQRAKKLGCIKMNIGIVEENQILRKWYEGFDFVHLGCRKYDFFPFTCGYMTREL